MSVSIPAGRINKLFGTDGGVMLSLYADFPADFDTDIPLLVTIDALEVPLWCERFERRGASGAVAAFADFDTERRAQELLGLEFRIRFDEEDDDEFYMEDLIGFAVTGFEIRHGGTETAETAEMTMATTQTTTPATTTAAEAAATIMPTPTAPAAPPATACPLPDNSQAGSRTIMTAKPTRSSSWKSAAAGCWSPPPRSSSPISTSRGAR